MGIPAAHVHERDLETEVGLDELRDLEHVLAQPAARIVGAVGGAMAGRIGLLEQLERLEALGARGAQEPGGGALVQRLERAGELVVAPPAG